MHEGDDAVQDVLRCEARGGEAIDADLAVQGRRHVEGQLECSVVRVGREQIALPDDPRAAQHDNAGEITRHRRGVVDGRDLDRKDIDGGPRQIWIVIVERDLDVDEFGRRIRRVGIGDRLQHVVHDSLCRHHPIGVRERDRETGCRGRDRRDRETAELKAVAAAGEAWHAAHIEHMPITATRNGDGDLATAVGVGLVEVRIDDGERSGRRGVDRDRRALLQIGPVRAIGVEKLGIGIRRRHGEAEGAGRRR